MRSANERRRYDIHDFRMCCFIATLRIVFHFILLNIAWCFVEIFRCNVITHTCNIYIGTIPGSCLSHKSSMYFIYQRFHCVHLDIVYLHFIIIIRCSLYIVFHCYLAISSRPCRWSVLSATLNKVVFSDFILPRPGIMPKNYLTFVRLCFCVFDLYVHKMYVRVTT